MKNIFLKVTVFLCITPYLFASETEIIWTKFGGATSMTGSATGDAAGSSVAISSNGAIVAVGEPGWDGIGGASNESGRVRTYSLQNGVWAEFGGAVSMTGATGGDQAGYSVAISSDGSIVAVGEFGWSGQAGRVRTYELIGTTWTEFGGATSMTGVANNNQAGQSVAISSDGSIVAVGEPNWAGIGSASGRVRTYSLQGGMWTEFGGATSMTGQSADNQAGYSVAISSDGSIVAVGEPFWNNVGRVRTYSLQGGIWTQFGGAISMTGQVLGDLAGQSLAISSDGNIVAVGEPGWDGDVVGFFASGRVRTYRLQSGVWAEFGGATSMTGQNAEDAAGYSVAISSDGSIVAVGERSWEEGGASFSLGRVRTYSLQNGIWTQFGGATSMAGQNNNDQAGYSVAINSDGTIVAVGEPLWDGVGTNSGRVRTYFYPSSNDNTNEFIIRNSELAHVCYSDISQGTTPGHQTNPGGVGQGAWFAPYHIMVQGR